MAILSNLSVVPNGEAEHFFLYDLQNEDSVKTEVISKRKHAEISKITPCDLEAQGDDFTVVSKKFFVQEEGERILKKARREASVMKSVSNHENVLKFLHEREDSENYTFYMEYAPEGTLKDLVNEYYLSNEEMEGYLLDICQGIAHIHSKGIIHGDLKCENIMISKGKAKIGDFGESFILGTLDAHEQQKELSYSIYFVAPEVLHGQARSKKCDIWSLGALAYELVTGEFPFYQPEFQHTLMKVGLATSLPAVPEGTSTKIAKLIQECGRPCEERPDIEELMKRVF